VVGNGDAVQTFGARGRNQIFRAGNTVSGKKRVRVQVDIKRHGERLWPLLTQWLHELFNKNACFGFGFLLNAIELVIVQPAIITGFFEQLGMCADLLNSARIHHNDLIGR